jgi:hypothetical protein
VRVEASLTAVEFGGECAFQIRLCTAVLDFGHRDPTLRSIERNYWSAAADDPAADDPGGDAVHAGNPIRCAADDPETRRTTPVDLFRNGLASRAPSGRERLILGA